MPASPLRRLALCTAVLLIAALTAGAHAADPALKSTFTKEEGVGPMHEKHISVKEGGKQAIEAKEGKDWKLFISVEGNGFTPSFFASFFMILVCEVGDKTFFIAAVMSMRHPRRVVFMGAIGALAVMTVLSVVFGWMLPLLMPIKYTHYLSVLLFLYFGVVLFKEAYQDDGESELEEVEAELEKKEEDGFDVESSRRPTAGNICSRGLEKLFSPIFIKAFSMTFLAEWGDRSQIATIALGSNKEPLGVIIGGILGHCICTGLAVVGGKYMSEHISERAVAMIGGTFFLFFGLYGAWAGPDSV